MSSSWSVTLQDNAWLCTGVAVLLAIFFKYIYRSTLHPLSGFPGPRLAAATSLYGAFYDLRPSTSYVKTFPALHEKYGPIVRIWPNLLQIADIEAYNQIFKIGSHFEKHAPFYAIPAIKGCFFSDPKRETALPRRALFAKEFNREAVRRGESRIIQCTANFLDKLGSYARDSRPVDMTNAFMCLTADGVMSYAYQKPWGALEAENFQSDILVPVYEFNRVLQWPTYFPRLCNTIYKVTDMLPLWMLQKWANGIVIQKEYSQFCLNRILELRSCPPGKERPATAFDTTLNPKVGTGPCVPPSQSLAADAFTFTAAGTGTSSNTLVVGLFNLMVGSPKMLDRLRAELRDAIPNSQSIVGWAELEQLPYLRAVIKESLRLSYGVPGRMPRVVPDGGAVLCGRKIPAGTLVSSSIYMHNMNPSVFPDPDRFQPERWLVGDPRLEQHLTSFSRGSRSCIGMDLAYCEMYLALGHLLRRFELKLYETTKEDMEWKDTLSPMTKGHLRVLLTQIDDESEQDMHFAQEKKDLVQ